MQSFSLFWQQENNHKSHKFTFKRLTPFKKDLSVQLDFSPIPNTDVFDFFQSQPQMVQTYPVYSNDNLFFTPGFILGVDRSKLHQFSHEYLDLHNAKLQNFSEEKRIIYIPKPAGRHMFCHVCKNNFEDYKQHIESQYHKKIILKSKFNRQIHGLCKYIQTKRQILRKRQKEEQKNKNKKIQKQRKINRAKMVGKQLKSQKQYKNKIQNITNQEESLSIEKQVMNQILVQQQ